MSKYTLIIGQSPDPHIEKVISLLKEGGKKVIFIDRYQLTNFLSVSYSGEIPEIRFKDSEGLIVYSDEIDKVWWRLKPFLIHEFSGTQALPFEKFRQKEWFSVLGSLELLLLNAKWINSPSKHLVSSKKPYQLSVAKKLGFEIPKTIISNDGLDILDFFKGKEKIIYKTLDAFIAPPDYMVFTTEVSRKQIQDNFVQIAVAPGIFQEKIEKKYELRVTIVGNEIFTAKIDSQNQEETQIDWRKNQFLPIYSSIKLSDIITTKILNLHKNLGLIYGAYDLIIDINDKPIYLECNPGGQWLWIENELGLPISNAIAKELF